MNFVLTTIGSAGDVFPMLGLAIGLRDRGHQVTLATNGHFASLAERHGIPFEQLGTAEQYAACIQNPALWHPRQSFQYIFHIFKTVLKRQHEILVEHSRRGPVIGLSSCLGFGARIAQESHGIPVLTVHLQPAVIWSDAEPPQIAGMFGPRWFKSLLYRLGEKLAVDRVVCPVLNPWRKELGLPPMKRVTRWWNSPTGVVCLFPDWFGPPQVDWPQPLIQTNFPLWNDGAHEPLNAELQRFLAAGDAPLVFTPGTANLHGRGFFEAAVQTCQTLNRRGIFLTRHPEQLPAGLPDSIRYEAYVPLDRLLIQSAGFIHHGGVGSTSQGFLAGVPQVLMPLAHDQFDNAVRVERLGVGKSVPGKDFNAKHLTAALQALLSSRSVEETCGGVKKRMSTASGLDRAVAEIEARYC